MFFDSVKATFFLIISVPNTAHQPIQVLALMQSGKGRPASGVAKFEECSCSGVAGWF